MPGFPILHHLREFAYPSAAKNKEVNKVQFLKNGKTNHLDMLEIAVIPNLLNVM